MQDNKLSPNEIQGLAKNIHGIEIDPGMAKIARVNLYLHGFKTPHITEDDTLSNDNLWGKKYDVILANPPFMSPKGGIVPHDKFGVNSKRAEVLFTDYIAEHLKLGGRAGVVVPEGVIFQSGTAYKQLRKMLIEDNYLWAVISLPAGVFNPYSGVKTSILLFDRARAEKNKDVMFFQVDSDGYGLGAQRREIKENNLPEALEAVNKWKENKKIASTRVLYVEKEKIKETGEYKLSIDNYKVAVDYSNVKWPMVELGEICSITTGRKDANEAVKNGLYPFFTCGKEILSINEYSFDSEAVLIAGNGDVGATKYYKGKFDAYQRTYILNNFKQSLPRYVYYILKETLQAYLFPKRLGNTMPYIKLGMLQKYNLPLPPLDIQIKIVEEVERYQNIIDGAEKIINNWKPSFEIDSEWKLTELKDVCHKITDGSHNPPKGIEKSDYLMLSSKDIKDGQITYNAARYLSKEDFLKENKRTNLQHGDVLLTIVGTLGRTAVYYEDTHNVTFQRSVAILKPDLKIIIPEYLKYIIDSDIIQKYILNNAIGVAQKGLYLNQISKIKIYLPPINIQNQIVNQIKEEKVLVDSARSLIEVNKQKIKNIVDKTWNK